MQDKFRLIKTNQTSLIIKAVVLATIIVVIITISIFWTSKIDQRNDLEADLETEAEIIKENNLIIPTTVKIDKLNLEATVGLLGLDEDTGELQVPAGYDEVGWYIYSPTPGEPGPAVILGHVDSYTGPAIFYSLGQLENGDQIAVQNNIGETHMFEVYKQTYYDQDNFATDEVYGNTSGPELRLITCSGEYDREAKRYTENLVIYAKAISA